MEKVKSFHSNLTGSAGSSRSMLAESSSGRMHQMNHTFEPIEPPIREESQEMLTTPKPSRRPSAVSPQFAQQFESEILIRRQTLGELDDSFDDLRDLMPTAVAAADEVMLDYKPPVSRPDIGSTAAVPSQVPAESVVVQAGDGTLKLSNIETLQTYSVMEAMERSREEQERMREAQRTASEAERIYVRQEDVTTGQEQRTREEPKPTKERGRRESIKKRVSLNDPRQPDQDDSDKHVPLSKSAIRAADAVTIDILERAIRNDIRQFSPITSQSLCLLGAMIVSRVLDSACSRMKREDRLPPAATWTEKARREAVLLVEDVLSSAMIYVSRGGDADTARPRARAATTEALALDMDDHIAAEIPVKKYSESEQMPQPPSALPWTEEYDDDYEEDGREEDVKENQEIRNKKASVLSMPSIPHGRLSIIEPPSDARMPEPAASSADHEHDDEKAMQPQSSDIYSFSLAQLSIIQADKPAPSDQAHGREKKDERRLKKTDDTESELAAQSSSKLHMHMARLSIIEQPELEGKPSITHRDSLVAAASPSILRGSGETVSLHHEASDAFRDIPSRERYGFASRRKSSMTYSEPSTADVNADSSVLGSTTSAAQKVQELRQLFGYRQNQSKNRDTVLETTHPHHDDDVDDKEDELSHEERSL